MRTVQPIRDKEKIAAILPSGELYIKANDSIQLGELKSLKRKAGKPRAKRRDHRRPSKMDGR
jgi:hypothetical protein